MEGRLRSAAALSLAAVLVLGTAACGDDDDADTGSGDGDGEEASGDAFCDSLLEFNTAVFQVELDEETPEEEVIAAGEELAPLFDGVQENAPESLSADAEELGATIDGLLEGDAEEFNSDATFEQYLGLVGGAVDECDFEETGVTAVDYAFEGVPDSLSAGAQAITLENQSEADEEHEMVIFRLADDETRSAEEILNDPATQEEGPPGEFVGAAFAPPGESGSALLDLAAGNYMAVCFIGVGGAEDGAPHFTQGMFAEFTVS